MFINQFKLDHLVEKNNECIIYRASHGDNKYMAIQLNRVFIHLNKVPLEKMKAYADHFQKELDFLFSRMPQPQIVGEFPFKIANQSKTTSICLPNITEIHVCEAYYYLILENCLEGTIHSQQTDVRRVFFQIFEIFDLYHREFNSNNLADRDFNPRRLFWSNKQLTLLDFGFSLFMKPNKISWVIKLGTLFNQITHGQSQQKKVKSVITTLLSGRIKWDHIQQLLFSTFEFVDDSIEPQEIVITPALYLPQRASPSRKPSRSLHANQYQVTPSAIQTRIIKAGTHNLKDHFDRIKKSLSPGLSNRTAMIRFMESSRNQSPMMAQQMSMTNNYLMSREINQFEYPIQDDARTKKSATMHEKYTYDQPLKETIKNDQTSESTYMPTIVEKLVNKQTTSATRSRPQTSIPKQQFELPHLKSLLRTSTRDLQQNDERSFSNTQTLDQNQSMRKPPSVRRNSLKNSARNSIQNSDRSSIQNLQMSDQNSIQQNSVTQTIEVEHFKKPKEMPSPTTKEQPKLTYNQIKQQIDENSQRFCQYSEQDDQQMPAIVLKKYPDDEHLKLKTIPKLITNKDKKQDVLSKTQIHSTISNQGQEKYQQRPITEYSPTDFEIKVIEDKSCQNNDEAVFKELDLKIKKYDTIGIMVGACINHFAAKKNYWIIPLFLCFKRMYSFRKILEDELRTKQLNSKSKELANKLFNNNIIVYKELQTIFELCQQQCKKFDPNEYKKIEKYMNMDEQQDLKDIYFVYLYTQIFKTLQNQTAKLDEAENAEKYKQNLKLQQSTLASVIVSEDIDQFNLDEYLRHQKDNQSLKKSIQCLEDQVIILKTRLNSKGIKL